MNVTPRRAAVTAAALAGAAVVASTPAAGQDAGLGGYAIEGRSSAVNFTYELPDALPTGDVVFQASLPESYVSLNNGLGRALSSLAWPGPLVAEAGSLAGFLAPPGSPPPPNLPPYPIRADSFHPQGPARNEVEPAPGARMLTRAVEGRSEASGSFTDVLIPFVLEVGGVTSKAVATSDGSVATSTSTTSMSDISLLGGLLRIEGLSSVLTATTDGVAATADAHTDIGAVTFAGMAATIDRDGIHLVEQEPQASPPFDGVVDELPSGEVVDGLQPVVEPASEALRQAIEETQGGLDAFAEQSGISIRQIPDESEQEGGRASASAGGILIELFYDGQDTPLISDLLDQVPFEEIPGSWDFLPPEFPRPPLTPQAIALMLKETHIFTITLANGDVSVSASEGFVFDFPTPGLPAAPSGSVAPPASTGSFSPSAGTAAPPAVGTQPSAPVVAGAAASAPATLQPVGIVRGIPNAWVGALFVLGVGLLARAGGRWLAAEALGSTGGRRP